MRGIKRQLQIALDEIGPISPIFCDEDQVFCFRSPLYDFEAFGDTPTDCIKTYVNWLEEFIAERMKGNLAPDIERNSPGRGGKRPGAGRPKGTSKTEDTIVIRMPKRIGDWVKSNKNATIKLLEEAMKKV